MWKKAVILFFLVSFFIPIVEGAEGSVFCLHGFLRSYRSMRFMERKLQKCGFDVCLWDYPSRKFTIREHACHLLPILQAKAREHPGEPIHFVCHSLGALILRSTLNMPGCPEEAKIGRAVLLAPPNRGSSLGLSAKDNLIARWMIGSKSGRELMNYTECDIICLGNFPPTMDVTVVAGTKGINLFFPGKNDGILAVEETILNTPFCFCKYRVSHGKIMTNSAIINLVVQYFLSYRSCEKVDKCCCLPKT